MMKGVKQVAYPVGLPMRICIKVVTQCLIVFALLLSINASAQDFLYSFSLATQAYQDLANPNVLELTNSSSSGFVPIGFPFVFGDSIHTNVRVTASGKLYFGSSKRLTFSGFGPIHTGQDSSGNIFSQLAYKVSGAAPNRLFSVQFKNFIIQGLTESRISFQITLIEGSNQVILHMGDLLNMTLSDSLVRYPLGPINPVMDSNHKAYCISGNPETPIAGVVLDMGDMMYMQGYPSKGRKYIITPISQ